MAVMMRTSHVGCNQTEGFAFECIDCVPDVFLTSPKNLNIGHIQLHQCSATYIADDNPVEAFAIENLERLAHAMRMVLVAVDDRFGVHGVCIDQHEKWGRSKMGAYSAVGALIFVNWNT